jgi:signal recognition particle receptor subunit beta
MADESNQNKDEEEIPIVVATPIFRTTIRQNITPYLPPPVVTAIYQIDLQLEPYVGPEPSLTILSSLCLALFVWRFLIRATGRAGGKAIQEDDDQEDLNLKQSDRRSFDSTLLILGPSNAGKTSLFYNLVYPERPMPLGFVKSISSNIGYVEQDSSKTVWRYLDVPGHWGASKLVSVVLQKETIDRMILVLDSTQPVSKAADYLYTLCQQSNITPILICCHKAKAPKAKNFRRIKLNLRNELERLDKLSANPIGKDWDKVLGHFEFCSSSIDPLLLDDIRLFCQTGSLTENGIKS